MDWKQTCFILCLYGVLKELRPSESFITEYLIGFKNLTPTDVIHDLYPILAYTVLGTSFIIFLVTDLVRYRPIMQFQGISFVACWITLLWSSSYFLLQVAQVLYGMALAADVAYYTYIYAQVEESKYQKATSYTVTATFIGKFLAASTAQILVSFKVMDFHGLIYITLVTGIGAFFTSFALPSVNKSMYKLRKHAKKELMTNNSGNVATTTTTTIAIENIVVSTNPDPNSNSCIAPIEKQKDNGLLRRVKLVLKFLWNEFKGAYAKSYVLKWSIWWTFANAGNLQIVCYTQPLWERIDSFENREIYNGAVGALQCFLGAFLTFGVGHIKVSWKKWSDSFLCTISILQGLALLWMSQTEYLTVAYGNYIFVRITFQMVLTIASSEVAHSVGRDSCGLIFGINTFISLIIQSVLTIIVTDKRGLLALDERTQFFVYGTYFIFIGLFFFILLFCSVIMGCVSPLKRVPTESSDFKLHVISPSVQDVVIEPAKDGMEDVEL